jgi:CRISPR-associated protein Cas2
VTVVVLTAVPPSLRGVLTRWLLEIAPGVFVGHVSARVRDMLWLRITEGVGRGRAILVHTARNEQRLAFRVHNHDWEPVDHEGVRLMMRPLPGEGRGRRSGVRAPATEQRPSAPANWSFAERRLRGRRPKEGKPKSEVDGRG